MKTRISSLGKRSAESPDLKKSQKSSGTASLINKVQSDDVTYPSSPLLCGKVGILESGSSDTSPNNLPAEMLPTVFVC